MLIETRFNSFLVLLSVLVAILASYVALNLAHSVTSAKGRARAWWLGAGAVAMGVGIWSMHFIGMLAFEMPGMAMAYDVPLMILSVVVAIGASALALFIVSRAVVPVGSLISGGISMAAAIAGMHYIGMYSMRMSASIEWDAFLVVVSIIIALVASFGALFILIRLRDKTDRVWALLLASMLMGIAIAGMHYTGMYAATFIHSGDHAGIHPSNLLVSSGLTGAVVTTTLIILGIALASSVTQRLWIHRTRKADAILGRSEERFRQLRSITNALPALVAQLDHNERFLFANDAFSDWFGYKTEGVIGKTFYDVLGPDRYAENELYIKAALRGEQVTYERESSNGRITAILNVTFVPEFDDQQTVNRFTVLATDITKHKEIQEELKKAKEDAEVANSTKSAFLANMSHEIRTPLGVIIGYSELLIDDAMSASERIDSFEVIKRNGRLLSNIINDILDLSKVEAGKLEFEKIDVSFDEILKELTSILSLEASAKGIELKVTAEGAIPYQIKTDPLRLRQILLNIVGNAIKFTKRGSVTVKVKILPIDGGAAKLAFVVTDTGEGIKPEQVDRLFTPFTQADASTTRKFGGTGLGLVLSRKLANALGGDVVLTETSPGKGSTFTITIGTEVSEQILFQNSQSSLIENIKTVPKKTETAKLRDLKVLIVDDSHDNRALIRRILILNGAKTETASNGREAIKKAVDGDFNVVLMDLQMPEIDGYEATKVLREQGYKKPVIALTAHAMAEERQRTLESGFDAHITKPIDQDLLLKTLAGYISGHQIS